MKNWLLSLSLFLPWYFQAQNISFESGTTRAVVIGISDYQDEKIPDLQFAHRDAEAFYNWLQSNAGAGLPEENIKLLINEKAKGGNIVAELTWLTDESKPGDKVIIYFSGHGDVEKATKFQRGYLLPYDSPPTTYMAGAIRVQDIQDFITTFSSSDVQVIMVSDACRAGKLAGSDFNGAQATTAALQQQFANEVKILSCQPDEYSVEGEEWGGGRGCFSYHLIDGLYGLADENGDLTVNLREIENYLEETVTKEVAPQSQFPMTVGNPKTSLASINEENLLALKTKKAEQLASLKKVDSKGIEDLVLAQVDTSILELYDEFLAAIDRNDLMAPDSNSADYYYRILVKESTLEGIHGYMKRNFAAALLNEAQDVTNKLLKTDPNVVSDSWSRPFLFDHIPSYLERAAEILGQNHFIFNQIKAKQYYFESKTYRPENYPELAPDSLTKISISKLEKGISYDSAAAYIYVDLAFISFYEMLSFEKSIFYSGKAIELSPDWVLAQYAAGNSNRLANPEKAYDHLQKALELDSTFLPIYQELSMVYRGGEHLELQKVYSKKYIQKIQQLLETNPEKVPILYRTYLGSELFKVGRFQEAEEILLDVEKLTNYKFEVVYQWLSLLYFHIGKYDLSLEAAEKLIKLKTPLHGYLQKSVIYTVQGQYLKAEQALKKVISISPSYTWVHLRLGQLYHYDLKRYEKAEKSYKKGLMLDSLSVFNGLYLYRELGDLYFIMERNKDSREMYQKILQRYPEGVTSESSAFIMNMVGKAHHGLGNYNAMKKTIKTSIQSNPEDIEVYYQAACLYSIIKKEKKALKLLEKAFEKGYRDYGPLDLDYDLHNVRNTKGYKKLMKKYFPDQEINK